MTRGARRFGFAVTLGLAVTLAACGVAERPAEKALDPERAAITQILLRYATKQHPEAGRTKAEARALAYALIERIRNGERMETVMLENTDDKGPDGRPFNDGVYLLVRGAAALPVVQKAVFDAPIGRVARDPVDTGLAYLVIRRNE